MLMGFLVFAIYYLSNQVYTPHSIVWFYLTIIGIFVDLLIIQNFKVLIKCIKTRKNLRVTIVPETTS